MTDLINKNIYLSSTPEFRSFDGTDNNKSNPKYGATESLLVDKVTLDYGDGFSTPTGSERPNPRIISNVLADQTENIFSSKGLTNVIWAFGQFIDHDLSLVADSDISANIDVPLGDLDLDPHGTGKVQIKMNESKFAESTGLDPSNPRRLSNEITAWLDGSNIYGSDAERAEFLRSGKNGKLKVSKGNLLPFNDGSQANDNPRDVDPTELFLAGDSRSNENSVLLSMHTVFVREHNRLATNLHKAHPGWTDEQIFQRAREINIAQYQAIIYQEYLPALLGVKALPAYQGYQPDVDPGITRVFSSAAFRIGHTQLSSEILRLDPQGKESPGGSLSLADVFFQSESVIRYSGIGQILRGISSSLSQEVDTKTIDDVRNQLFGFGSDAAGRDLFAINLNRGRLNGVADFNTVRKAFGLPTVHNFAEITANPELQNKLAQIYGDVNQIDAFVGLMIEDKVDNTAVGKTLSVVLADQFAALRDGDRFFYQNHFSASEIAEIEKVTFSKIIKQNTDTTNIQDNAFSLVNHGTSASEKLNGGLGNDTISAHGGNDTIAGFAGEDLLYGNAGKDEIYGGFGNDTVQGGYGKDLIQGNQGHDQLFGNADSDYLSGNQGNDTLNGGPGHDYLAGNKGHDLLKGKTGNDVLLGGTGNDTLQGNRGKDTLRGQNGNDLLDGGKGHDILEGGHGYDQFVLRTGHGFATIVDYQDGIDRLVLKNGLRFAELEFNQVGDNVQILHGSDQEIVATINGVETDQFDHSDFQSW